MRQVEDERELREQIAVALHLDNVVRGYPCLKPDAAVLNAAASLRMVERRKADPESLRRHVVAELQRYSIDRGTPMAVLDLYLMICGGQSDARRFVRFDLATRP